MFEKKYEDFKRGAVNLHKKFADENLQTVILAVKLDDKKVFHDSAIAPENAVAALATEIYNLTKGNADFQKEMIARIEEYLQRLNPDNVFRTIILAAGNEPLKFQGDELK